MRLSPTTTSLFFVLAGLGCAPSTLAADPEESGDATLDPIMVESGRAERSERTQSRDRVSGETAADYNPANNYDSLRLVPGVSFIRNGTRYSSPSRIRGSTLWTIADSIEGLPTVRPAGNGTEDGGFNTGLGAIIPGVAVESVGVAKGGLGVRYGGNVDGGVINTDLQRGQPGPLAGEVVIDASDISEQLAMADAGGGTRDGRWDYYVAGKALEGDYDEVTTRFGEEQFDQSLTSGLVRTGYQATDDTRFEVLGVAGQEQHAWRDVASGDRFETTNETGYLALSAEHAANGEDWFWRGGYTRYDRDAVRDNRTSGTIVRDRPQETDTVFASAGRAVVLSEDVRWEPEFGVQHVDHLQREVAPGSRKSQQFEDTSVSWSNTLAIGERWTLTGGLRHARLDSDGGDDDITVHELGVARDFTTTGTRVYASHSSSYYRNKGFVFFASGAFGGDEIPGGLPVAETDTAELGLRQALPLADGGHARIAVFQSETENAPNFAGLFGTSNPQVNFDTSESEGIEFSADLGITSNLRAQLSYAHLETEIVDATSAATGRIGDSILGAPEDTAGAALAWQPTEDWRLSTIATWDSGFRQVNESPSGATVTESDSFLRWNAAAEWQVLPALAVGMRIENLLDEDDLNFKSSTSGPGGTTTSSTGETPGRIFAVNLRYTW